MDKQRPQQGRPSYINLRRLAVTPNAPAPGLELSGQSLHGFEAATRAMGNHPAMLVVKVFAIEKMIELRKKYPTDDINLTVNVPSLSELDAILEGVTK